MYSQWVCVSGGGGWGQGSNVKLTLVVTRWILTASLTYQCFELALRINGGGVVPQAEKWHLEGFKWLHLTFNVKVWWKKCTLHILGENGGCDVIVLRDGGRKISKNGLKNEIAIFYLKLIRLTPKLDRCRLLSRGTILDQKIRHPTRWRHVTSWWRHQ